MLHTKYQSSRPSTFREEEFQNLSSLFLCSNLWTPRQDQSWPKGHHMNKLGRGPQGDATYKISKLQAFQFQSRRIIKFSFLVPTLNLWPPGLDEFWPQGHFMNKIGKGPQGDAHTKYQISTPSSCTEEKIWRWASLFLCSNLWPPDRGQFWPQGHHMNKLGRGHQGDAIHHVSKL